MPEDVSRRIYYFLDEASAIGRISVESALNQGAGKGASLWLLIQSFAQLDVVYGRETRDAIVNGCGLSIYFSVADPNTAKILSEKVGDVEYYEKEVAMSYGVSTGRDGENFRRTKKCEKLFLPVEFMQLKKFECIVSVPDFGITRTKIPFIKVPMKQPAFIIKPEFNLEVIAAEYKELMAKTAEYREKTPLEILLEQEEVKLKSSNEKPEYKSIELDIDQY
jgi:type IV secretory pathway TraG/TraD family ATPase VirD4